MSFHFASTFHRRSPDACTTIADPGVATDEMSVVRTEIRGRHEAAPNRRSRTTYVCVTGSISVSINGETAELGAGDIAVSPIGATRVLEGNADLLVINTPRFDIADER